MILAKVGYTTKIYPRHFDDVRRRTDPPAGGELIADKSIDIFLSNHRYLLVPRRYDDIV